MTLLFSSLSLLIPGLLSIQEERVMIQKKMQAYSLLEEENIRVFFTGEGGKKELTIQDEKAILIRKGNRRCVIFQEKKRQESVCVSLYKKEDSRSLKQS